MVPVDVVTTPASAGLLQNNPTCVVFSCSTSERPGGIGGLWAMARMIRRHRAERDAGVDRTVAYLAQGSPRSAALAVLAGMHERDRLRDVAGSLDVHAESALPRESASRRAAVAARVSERAAGRATSGTPSAAAFPGCAEKGAVNDLLREHGVSGPFVALAPGSVWATKRWPYYAELAQRVSRRVAADRRRSVEKTIRRMAERDRGRGTG